MLCLSVSSFSYTHDASFSEQFLLHTSCYIYSRGVSLTLLMLCLSVRSFPYTPDATFSEEFLLPFLMLVLVKSFSYTPHAYTPYS